MSYRGRDEQENDSLNISVVHKFLSLWQNNQEKDTTPCQGFVPWEWVVKDECVEAWVTDFQLALNCLFMGIAAGQWNQDLRTEQGHWSEMKLRTVKNFPEVVCQITWLLYLKYHFFYGICVTLINSLPSGIQHKIVI